MKYHIYLFRHGQTYFNRSGRFTGWVDSKLTPKGLRQAESLAKKMKRLKFQVAFTSPLTREIQTLKKVLKYHPECKELIIDNRLIERSYGKLERKYHKTIIREYGLKQYNIWHRSYDVPPPKGESIKMVEKRVYSFIEDLLKFMNKRKVNVAICAHGNSMRPFRRYFQKLTIKQMMTLENPFDDYFDFTVDIK